MRKSTKIQGSIRLTSDTWEHIEQIKNFYMKNFYMKISTADVIEACIEKAYKEGYTLLKEP